MNRVKTKVMLVFGLAVLGAVLPRATADEWDQKTVFTFSGPVEIPGQVLPAGTYVFKLADSPSDRNIVQVFQQGRKTSVCHLSRDPRLPTSAGRKNDYYVRRAARRFSGGCQSLVLSRRELRP